MAKTKNQECIPSAKRLVKSLRDIGYNFHTAVADLVDNSVEAGATVVEVWISFDGDESYVRISDNGKGMNKQELLEAMRYGSNRDYEKDSLGKFGLGLKTASMSQCQCFSVASRNSKWRNNLVAYSWDLAHIEKTDRWEILPPKRKKLLEILADPISKNTGTVVVWERLDRILGYKHPYGEQARRKLFQMTREMEQHLGMVFHRFLTREAGRKKLQILVNGNEIKAWDPFVRHEENTQELSQISLDIVHEGKKGSITLRPYVLPAKDQFSTPAAFNDAAGPKKWNAQQGFYIYRANRMIQSGGWCKIRARDEHTKLSRISIDFQPKFDSAFKINVAKMMVQLPTQLRDQISDSIIAPVRIARETYDKKPKKSAALRTTSTKNTENKKTGGSPQYKASSGSVFSGGSQSQKWTVDEIEAVASAVATKEEKPMIHRLFQRIRNMLFGKK